MFNLLFTFFISIFISFISLPLINRFALKKKLLDFTDIRKQSRNPIPRIGGLSIFLGAIVPFSLLIIKKDLDIGPGNWQVLLILSVGFFLIGFIDDIFNISPWPRLSIQVSFSAIAWFQNLRIESIDLTYLDIGPTYYVLPKYISLILTIFWIVGLTNAINWIDGLDGLAAGVTLIGLIGLLIINIKLKQFDNLYILIPIIGSCLSFLKYNFYPAKIIMGDGGSYLLGSLLAFVSIISFSKTSLELPNISTTAIYIPIILFSVPILDMMAVIVFRILQGRSPFFPDKAHLHHRLMNKGISHRNTVILIYLFSVFATCISISFVL